MALLQDYKVLFEQNTEIKEIFYQGQRIWPSVITPPDPQTIPFTVRNMESSSIEWPVNQYYSYSTVAGEWTTPTEQSVIELGPGEKMMIIRATQPVTMWQNQFLKLSNKRFNISGNILSLLDGDNFPEITSVGGSAFNNIFANTQVDIDELTLYPTTYTGSSSAYGCYETMFRNCASLTKSPVICLDTLSGHSCWRMFQGCSNLTEITCLATSKAGENETTDWVNGVAQNGTFYCKDASIWPTGTSGIPSGWTVEEV